MMSAFEIQLGSKRKRSMFETLHFCTTVNLRNMKGQSVAPKQGSPRQPALDLAKEIQTLKQIVENHLNSYVIPIITTLSNIKSLMPASDSTINIIKEKTNELETIKRTSYSLLNQDYVTTTLRDKLTVMSLSKPITLIEISEFTSKMQTKTQKQKIRTPTNGMDELEKDRRNLQELNAKLTARNDLLELEKAQLQLQKSNNSNESKTENNEIISDLESKLTMYKSDYQDLQKKLTESCDQLQRKNEAIKQLTEFNENKDAVILDHKNLIQKRETELENLKKKSDILSQDCYSKKKEIEYLAARKERYRENVDELMGKIDILKKEKQKIVEERECLKKEAESSTEKYRQVKKQLDSLTEKIDGYKNRLLKEMDLSKALKLENENLKKLKLQTLSKERYPPGIPPRQKVRGKKLNNKNVF